jgi:hypothetical protein
VGHNPQAQDLLRNKHNLVEGRILKEPWNVYRRSHSYSIGGYVKSEGYGETIVVLVWFAESMELSELSSWIREICNACEDARVLECEIH